MITIDFNRLDLKKESKVLDIGCGEGRHTAKAWEFENTLSVGADRCYKDLAAARDKLQIHEEFINSYLKSQYNSFNSYSNLENSSTKSENSSFNYENFKSKWVLCNSDITSLPFADNTFDIVICSEVMEHIHEEQKALKELKRILKPNGNLAISVPRYLPEKICWTLSKEYCNTKGGHIRIYKKRELIKKITDLGFKFKGSHYAHSLHTPFWWLKCMMGCSNKNPSDSGFNIINLYHRFLVWDIMEKPFITRLMERLLNPVIGKSLVIYLNKG